MLPPLRAQSGSLQELLARSRREESPRQPAANPPSLPPRPRAKLVDDLAAVLRRGRNSPDSLPQAALCGESTFGGNCGNEPRRNPSAGQALDLRTQPSRQKFADVYRVGALLGVGSFATVHEATHRLIGENFVVKVIKARDEGAQEEEIRRQTVVKEITACARLAHPNICQFYGYFDEPDVSYLIMERLEGTDLFEFLSRQDNGEMAVDEEVARQLTSELISALQHCHQNGVCHRDVKPENILVMATPDGQMRLKLIDFGIAHVGDTLFDFHARDYCGTRDYMSPEIILRLGRYDARAGDMWSVGVSLFVLLYGSLPFNREYREHVIAEKGHPLPTFPTPDSGAPRISRSAIELLESLLSLDPVQRPSAAEALKHSWFQVIEPESVAERIELLLPVRVESSDR
jgi:serine/threonine protein kinase